MQELNLSLSRVITLFATTGNGKSSMALKSSRKKAYFEFDPGSFARAESGLDIIIGKDVDIYQFHPPFDLEVFIDEGKLDTSMRGESGKGAVTIIHKLYGWEELRREFRRKFAEVLQDPDIGDIIFDTGDDLWTIEQNAFKQRKQDEVNLDATQLNRLEYKECNQDMLQYYMAAKSKSKNLIVVCHEGDEWSGGKQTGQVKPAGWNDGPEKSDVTIQLRRRNKKPYGIVKKAGGADLALIDMEIEESAKYPLSIDTVISLIDAATFLRKNVKGEELPETMEEILDKARTIRFKLENS